MPAFRDEPVYTWLLHTFDSSERDSMRERLFRGFFTQCALNNGLFIEAGDYASCGVFMPPGATVENSWTMLKAGLLPALWSMGLGFLKVPNSSCYILVSPFCILAYNSHLHLLSTLLIGASLAACYARVLPCH